MIIASATQFYGYLAWGQHLFSIVRYSCSSLLKINSVLNVKVLVGTFNHEKALVGAFSVIVQTDCETDGSSAALVLTPAVSRISWTGSGPASGPPSTSSTAGWSATRGTGGRAGRRAPGRSTTSSSPGTSTWTTSRRTSAAPTRSSSVQVTDLWLIQLTRETACTLCYGL